MATPKDEADAMSLTPKQYRALELHIWATLCCAVTIAISGLMAYYGGMRFGYGNAAIIFLYVVIAYMSYFIAFLIFSLIRGDWR